MKLKNSYILLIVISLFLLVSIGSVCAEANSTADADILSEDSSDIILSDNEASDSGSANITKIDTTVESENVLVNEKDTVEIPVTVKDNESNIITITTDNITVNEGSKTIKFNYNNSKLNVEDKLDIGNHSLIINYLGNDIYKNSTTNIILSIFGNKTIDAPSFVTSDGITVEIPVNLTDGVNTYSINKNNLTLNFTYVDENGNSSFKIIDSFDFEKNTVKFLLNDLKFASASVILNYNGETESSKKVVIKSLTNVTAQNAKFNESDNKTIPISVSSGDKQINVTKNEINVLENNKQIAFEYNNSIITIKSLTSGNHTITVKFLGNDNFAESSKDILVSVYGNITINADSSINVNSTKKGQVTIKNITNGVDIIDFNLSDLKVTASYKVGNDTFIANVNMVKLENNTLFIEFENLNFTTATLNITYKNTALTSVTVNRIYNAKITVITSSNQYQNGAFKFKLVDTDTNSTISGKTINLYTIGNIRAGFSATTGKDGIASFYTKNLYEFDNTNNSFTMRQFEVGKHGVEISTSGDVKTTTIKTN
ncbi:hypothetical protein, partial [Methanobrevibacter sp.]|uniref:hypothetical protein n=1 Tax=Methanobrevibacter sp. TaxID=66852 RepID=UPI0026DFD80E